MTRTCMRSMAPGSSPNGVRSGAAVPLSQPLTTGIGLMLGGLAHGVGWPVARGGSQRVADALVARLRAAGGEVLIGIGLCWV